MARTKKTPAVHLSDVMQSIQAGHLVHLPDLHMCTIDASETDVLSLTMMLKQMRRRHLHDFVQYKTPEKRELAWAKADKCQAGLFMITKDDRYNAAQKYTDAI